MRRRRAATVAEDRDKGPLGLEPPVPDELGLARIGGDRREILLGSSLLRGALRALALLVHQLVEALLVDLQARVLGQLARELSGEAVRVVELEHDFARERAPALGAAGLLFEERHALPERGREALLLRGGNLLDVGAVLDQLRVGVAKQLDGAFDEWRHDVLLDPEPPRVAHDAAQHAAQDVASALVRGLHAVGDQERGGPAVLGDHLQRNIGALVGPVCSTRERLGHLQQRPEQVRLEDVVHVLEDGRDALDARAGVDVLGRELTQDRFLVVDLVLHEHVVPDLDMPLLVDLGTPRAPVLRAAVDVDLRARPGGARRVRRPVVVELAAANDPLPRHADVLPDVDGLVVGLEHRHPQPVGVDAPGLGHQLVPPTAGLALEVVAEGEVAEHLEERAVARRVTDVLDVERAEDLLHGHGARERRLRVTEEVRDELIHPGVGEEQARLGRRDQRRRGHHAVAALLEEAQERLADPPAFHGKAQPT